MVVVLLAVLFVSRGRQTRANTQLADARADARRVIERLGGQVYNLTGSDEPSRQALADAGERFNAAGSQIEQASTPAQARLAKETALEGLYYVRAARSAMGMDLGPAVPELDGQRSAGKVTEDRTVDYNGRRIEASPDPSAQTPNYYPGGRVAGRPVPAGWYSEPWWRTALVAGVWGVGSVLLFDALFTGMSGIGYDAAAFESGYGDGYQAGLDAGDTGGDSGNQSSDSGQQGSGASAGDQGYDSGDQNYGDPGYDSGDPGYSDAGFADPRSDLGGSDFGDYGDFGGFDGFDGGGF
ncbi:DUF1542 domain-containing protein [Nocardia sp. SYP-A9097]|uniref:DUF1542 domain-containing protein n=1 Tax=Nocardia sp. SYP-A9097 TaxID=2663237 RepID=UPI00129B698A|nr:DUF1542 domain-containing protein [Nocardia sp. SYP-A9097]MRH89207.1 DUF1542 domain-containing protein [Nocardia sp. SYP-A9097]